MLFDYLILGASGLFIGGSFYLGAKIVDKIKSLENSKSKNLVAVLIGFSILMLGFMIVFPLAMLYSK